MDWFWFVSMSFFSSVGFGAAAYYAEFQPLIGINVGIGVFCFILALVSGIKRSLDHVKEDAK